MTFIERQISILAAAIFGLILIRVFISTDASGFNVNGFQNGFMQYRTWLLMDAPAANASDTNLANLISNAIRKQRNAAVLPLTDPDIITGSTGAPAEKKSELQDSEKETATVPSSENKDVQASVADADKAANASSAKPSSTAVAPINASQQGDAERTLLERLGLRRSELEKREEELSKREALLQAAEKRLSERSDELLRLEADLKSRTDQRNAELLSLKPIVTIYETMKPKDAARVFEKLDFSNLLTLSAAMNPRKLSDVLAQMDPALAGKLTKSMSTQNRAAVLPPPLANADTGNELPDFNPQGTP